MGDVPDSEYQRLVSTGAGKAEWERVYGEAWEREKIRRAIQGYRKHSETCARKREEKSHADPTVLRPGSRPRARRLRG
jgi:hypothetical protein